LCSSILGSDDLVLWQHFVFGAEVHHCLSLWNSSYQRSLNRKVSFR
jgi:hypothetical protein